MRKFIESTTFGTAYNHNKLHVRSEFRQYFITIPTFIRDIGRIRLNSRSFIRDEHTSIFSGQLRSICVRIRDDIHPQFSHILLHLVCNHESR